MMPNFFWLKEFCLFVWGLRLVLAGLIGLSALLISIFKLNYAFAGRLFNLVFIRAGLVAAIHYIM